MCGQEGLVPSSLEWGGRAGEAPGAIGGYLARMESVSQAHKSKFTLGAAFLFFHLKKKKKSYKSIGAALRDPPSHPATSTFPGSARAVCSVCVFRAHQAARCRFVLCCSINDLCSPD